MAYSTPPTEILDQQVASPTRYGGHLPLARRPKVQHLTSGEAVYALYHRHPIVFLRGLLYPAAAFLVVLVLALALNTATADNPTPLGGLLVLASVFIVAGWIVYIYADWRADYLLITDRRILLNIETPGIRTVLREVPLGKVQNVTTLHARLSQLLKKLIKVGDLVMDMAGLGQVKFDDISEADASQAQALILDLQSEVRTANRQPREQYRRDVIQSILQGTELPRLQQRIQVPVAKREGYTTLNRLIPRKPWCEGMEVIWHKHWWFLLLALLKPLGLLLAFELANLVVAVVGNLLGIGDNNQVLNFLGWIRPLVYLVLLPFMVWQWEDWRNDKYIVNQDQLRSVDTLPLGLEETVKETNIRNVVDATVTVDGVLPKLLGFGNVVMETPGESVEFIFEGVPRPFEVQREIMTRIEALREQEQVQWDRDIQEWLQAYVEERRAEPSPQLPPADPGFFGW